MHHFYLKNKKNLWGGALPSLHWGTPSPDLTPDLTPPMKISGYALVWVLIGFDVAQLNYVDRGQSHYVRLSNVPTNLFRICYNLVHCRTTAHFD